MPTPKPENSVHGSVVIARWELMQGDTIPLHDHTTRPLSQHVTIVCKGSVSVNFPDTGETLNYTAGDCFDYLPEQQKHEIVATADAILFNVSKAVIP